MATNTENRLYRVLKALDHLRDADMELREARSLTFDGSVEILTSQITSLDTLGQSLAELRDRLTGTAPPNWRFK